MPMAANHGWKQAPLDDRRDPLERGLVVILLVMFVALAAMPAITLFLHVPRNNNEGWNAYQAAAAMSGGVLYPPWDAMTADNYPPLSYYVVGLLGLCLGDNIIAGRLIALLALLVTAGNVYRMCRWMGGDRILAAFGMSWFLLAIYSLRPGYIAMNDPQFLALALVSSGAVVFLNANEQRLFRTMLVAAGLVIAGGLVKQNVIALPIALCTWAVFHDRRRLGLFIVACLGLAAPLCVLGYALWGQALLDNLLFLPRQGSWWRSIAMTWQIAPVISPFLGLAILGSVLTRPADRATFAGLFLFWSAATGFWMLSGAGVNYNVMFDLVLALAIGCVAAAVAASKMALPLPVSAKNLRRLVMSVIAATQIACTLYYYRNPVARDVDALFHAGDWSSLTHQLAQSKGPVACEVLAVCYWAHKPLEVDFFNYGQKLFSGSVSDAAFRGQLNSKYYAFVLIHQGSLSNPPLPADTMQSIFANYRPVRLVAGDALLLEPVP
jgi:hypothetical protein